MIIESGKDRMKYSGQNVSAEAQAENKKHSTVKNVTFAINNNKITAVQLQPSTI